MQVECPERSRACEAESKGYNFRMHYVYMIKDNKNRLYIGVSNNPSQRLQDHNHMQGAVFTHEGNFKMVFLEKYLTLKEARSREVQMKKWRREKKDFLIKLYEQGIDTR